MKTYKVRIRPAKEYDGPELNHNPASDLLRVFALFMGVEFSGFAISVADLAMLDEYVSTRLAPDAKTAFPYWTITCDPNMGSGAVYFQPKDKSNASRS